MFPLRSPWCQPGLNSFLATVQVFTEASLPRKNLYQSEGIYSNLAEVQRQLKSRHRYIQPALSLCEHVLANLSPPDVHEIE